MNKEVCRTLALGSLVRGYFHNLRGTLQSLSLQLQILHMKRDQYIAPQGQANLDKAINLLQKLQTQIEVALEDINNENTGPWDLKEVLEKELLFWEANLYFKHKVVKQLEEQKKVLVNLPLAELRGILCLIGEVLYPNIQEGTTLKIIIDESPNPVIIFQLQHDLEEKIFLRLKVLASLLESPYTLIVEDQRIILSIAPS